MEKDLNPTAVDENNNNSVKHANTVLETDNILVAHVMEKRKNGLTNELTTMTCGIVTPTQLQKELK